MSVIFKPTRRIVLLGGGSLLRDLARWCVGQELDLKVVTSPRQAHENLNNGQSLVQAVELLGVPFLVTESIGSRECRLFLGDLGQSFVLSVGAAWIFEKEMLDTVFCNRLLNLHGSRLPLNRGGGGFTWQILMGTRFGYCQLHVVDSGIDTGPIAATHEFLYPPTCRTPKDYSEIYEAQNRNFIETIIGKVCTDGLRLPLTAQAEYLSSYFPRLHTEVNGWIDWTNAINDLERFICAFDEPYTGALTMHNGEPVHIRRVSVEFSDQSFHPFQYGLIYRRGPKWICVCAKGGSLIVEEITDTNGRSAIDNVRVGDRFTTPANLLESRMQRVSYTPRGLREPDR